MEVSTGSAICFSVLMIIVGAWLGHTTSLPDHSQVFLYALRRYVKYGGWLVSVMGFLILVRIVLTVLGVLPEPQ